MRTDVRLNSVVPHGVGGPEAQALELIYIYLLREFGQNFYSRIGINQVGEDLNEFVVKESGNKIHINIRYPVYNDFDVKSIDEKNLIRLDVVHTSLMRIAEYDNRLEKGALAEIKNKILTHQFDFKFVYKTFINPRKKDLIARILIHPLMDRFEILIAIERAGSVNCETIIFKGISGFFYLNKYFFYGKWKNDKLLVISGKEKEVETHVLIDECTSKVINLTPYDQPPYFTLMKKEISDDQRKKSNDDWLHSLPPAVAAILRNTQN